jgi:cation transport protein ChaC
MMNTTTPERLTPAQMRASLDAALAHWNRRDPLWVFAYGSLIWNPELEFDRRAPARLFGHHRGLCLRSVRNRGTPERPGLVAGLDRGGSCAGVVYRVPARAVHAQFERLWEREMFLASYHPRWVRCHRLDRPETVRAMAFIVRRDAPNYCGRLPPAEILGVLRHARGTYGSSREYLLKIVSGLRAEGLADPALERLALQIEPE